jgi:hypothetical protein
MTRLMIAAIAVLGLGCSGKGKQAATTGEPIPAKRVVVSWGFQPEGEMTDIFLATTDETGKQVSHPLGRYKGTCEKITPAKEMTALTGAACTTGGGGTELHAVVQGDDIIIMQMGTSAGATPDPMAREEVKRIGFPLGAAVEAAP